MAIFSEFILIFIFVNMLYINVLYFVACELNLQEYYLLNIKQSGQLLNPVFTRNIS